MVDGQPMLTRNSPCPHRHHLTPHNREKEAAEHSALKAEVVKLEALVRRQKQQTDEVKRWMANEGASATLNKLRNQLASLGGDMDNLRFRQRIELQIAQIPIPEGDEQLCVSRFALLCFGLIWFALLACVRACM
jgi:cytochrome oxidase assembly protein ShyY1